MEQKDFIILAPLKLFFVVVVKVAVVVLIVLWLRLKRSKIFVVFVVVVVPEMMRIRIYLSVVHSLCSPEQYKKNKERSKIYKP